MTDTKHISDAIKGLPENARIEIRVGLQQLGTVSVPKIATADLKALVAEKEALKEHIQNIVNFGSQDVTLEVYKEIVHHESVEILTGKPSGYDFDGGNDD